jgi:hypothetical protein
MAKAKAKQADTSTHTEQSGNGQLQERLTNKTEAVRHALAKLGKKAMPAEIQDFIKTNFGIELTTKVISVYKCNLARTKGKPGRKPKAVQGTAEAVPNPAAPAGVTFKDLRAVREITNRLGPARMRELVELMRD